MVSIDFIDIDNSKMIGRLLPFWVRGKRVSLLLQALLYPLTSIHATFKTWALKHYIECHITAQRPALEWYLNYNLKSHFKCETDSFCIVSGANELSSCFSANTWRNGLYWNNLLKWEVNTEPIIGQNMNFSCINTGVWENNLFWNNSFVWDNEENNNKYNDLYLESNNQTNVFAPSIIETLNYSNEDYERDIRNILSKFMINFNKINILIVNQEINQNQ